MLVGAVGIGTSALAEKTEVIEKPHVLKVQK